MAFASFRSASKRRPNAEPDLPPILPFLREEKSALSDPDLIAEERGNKRRRPNQTHGNEPDLPERLSALRREAQRKRVAYNQARTCERCAPPVALNHVESLRHRKFDRSTA